MTQRNAYCINQADPMRNQPHPWNLSRIFGRQFVVCVGSPSRPEARIAARVIPAQSSRRIFRGPSDADLATLVVDVHRCANPHTLIRPNSGVTSSFNRNVEKLASIRASRKRHAFPSPSKSPKVYLGVISWHYTVPVTPVQFQKRVTSLFRLLIENKFCC